MRWYWFLSLLWIASATHDLHGQLMPFYTDRDVYHDLQRLGTLYSDTLISHGILPYDRAQIFAPLDEAFQRGNILDRELALSLIQLNTEWATDSLVAAGKRPLWNTFYESRGDFFAVSKRGVYLRVNPMWHFQWEASNRRSGALWRNQRGLEFRMGVDDRFFVYTRIWETQRSTPRYIHDYESQYDALPGQGFYKLYRGGTPYIAQGYDYLNADGGLGIRLSPHVQAHVGHGKHFIGSGLRSMMLSDFSDNYFFLRFEIDVGFLSFRQIVGELNASSPLAGDGQSLLPTKYFASHYLSFRVAPRLRMGLWESIVFQRSQGFELQYLNPVIFYRSVEQKLGSPDNILLGLDAEWQLSDKTVAYGQFVLDELVVSELFGSRGWWGNKYAFQVGVKSYNLAQVDGLDLQMELNATRPFVYAHSDSLLSFSHAHQALAHPLGSNFGELVGRLRYRPSKRWIIESWVSHAVRGRDPSDDISEGSEILKPSGKRNGDYDHHWFQGREERLTHILSRVTWQMTPSLHLDVSYRYRSSSLAQAENVWSLGLRWNSPFQMEIY